MESILLKPEEVATDRMEEALWPTECGHWLIYGLTFDPPPLAQLTTVVQKGALTWGFAGAACRNRTDDLLITSETLYRLS